MPRIPRKPVVTDDTEDSSESESSTEGLTATLIEEKPLVAGGLKRMGKLTVVDTDPYRGVPDAGEWDALEILASDESERHIYRASELGNCLAALCASALGRTGADMPAKLQPRLDEGTTLEPVILDAHGAEYGYRPATYDELVKLKQDGKINGYNLELQQIQTVLDVGQSARVRCHIDRIVTHVRPANTKTKTEPTFYIAEAKAFGPDYWKKWKKEGIEGFPRYGWQLSAAMHSTGMTGIFIVGKKSGEDADVTVSDVDVTVFEVAPFPIAKVKARVLKAEALVKEEEIPPCQDGTWPCRFFAEAFCLGKPKEVLVEIQDLELGQLCALYYAYSVDMAATDEQKEAEKERKKIKDRIDKWVANAGYDANTKVTVRSEVGELFEFEWVVREQERSAFTMKFPTVKLIVG